MKKVLYAFILMLCLVGGLGVGLVYRKHLADQAAGGGGDGGAIIAANDTSGQNNNGALGIPGAIATTTAPDSAAGDVGAALAAGGQPASTMAPATPVSTQPELSTSDVTGRSGEPMGATDFTPSSSGGSSSSSSTGSSSSSSSGSGHHHHGSSSAGSTTTTFSSSEPAGTPIPKSQTVDDSNQFGTESGGAAEPTPKPGKHGKTPKATPAPTSVASSGGTDAEMPTIDDNSGGGSSGGGSDPFGTMDSTPAATPQPTRVAMIPKGGGGGELDFPSGSGGSYLKKVTQRQNGDKSIIHVDLAGSASYRVIALRNPSRVFIDFEETSVPGGSSQPVAGTVNHVKEIVAKQFTSAGGISIARVQITLTDDKVPGASKGTADGGLDVVLGEKQDSF